MVAMASVVLVHGIRTSATMWRQLQRALTAAGISSVAVDLPGHGSRDGEPFSKVASRAVLDDAVAALPGPHVVVGLSLGSYLAIDWAARTARPPAALVLASCGTRPRGPGIAAYIAVARLISRLPDAGLGLHTRLVRAVLGSAAEDVLAAGSRWGRWCRPSVR